MEAFLCPPAGQTYAGVSGRSIAALFNPRPTLLIGTYKERANFTTLAWATPVSYEPVLVAISLRPASKSYLDLIETECFSINVLDASLRDLAQFCGKFSGHIIDKSECVVHHFEPHSPYRGSTAITSKERVKTAPFLTHSPKALIPFVEGALSILDCELESVRPAGDHNLVIAYVCKALTRCTRDEGGALFSSDSLLCVQRDHYSIANPHCLT